MKPEANSTPDNDQHLDYYIFGSIIDNSVLSIPLKFYSVTTKNVFNGIIM
jgi:hypothetical protein